jgi:nitrite reductase (NADH) large subunit
VKDLGMIGQEGSWQIVIGGAAGKSVRKADLLITVNTTEEAYEASDLFFQYYRENGNYLERTYDFVERLGIEKVRKETVYAAAEDKQALLERLARSKAIAKDPWLERDEPATPTQFVQIQPMGPVAIVDSMETKGAYA